MERPAPIRGTWVMLRIGRKAVQSHKQKEPVYEENKICRVGCPCGDDRRSGSGARGGNTVLGSDSESRGVGRKLVKKLGPVEQLRFCYEAGPTGYALYWHLSKMGA